MVQTFPVPRTGVTGVLVGQPHNMSALGLVIHEVTHLIERNQQQRYTVAEFMRRNLQARAAVRYDGLQITSARRPNVSS